ncbi:DegT/DnrJ/EryC1/StrS family aminotransferase [Candidatus Collierbacteria bacterium]|nr:DegT/DnrJ/EryC1/StrS family aminotransferase [Candidatus Collierbacteria bacterium]
MPIRIIRIALNNLKKLPANYKPAIEGGKPVRENFLVFGRPMLFREEIKEVLETLRSDWWGTGQKTKEFEKLFAKYAHAKYALALSSCTAATELALDILGIGPGDEVITTPLTFVSTANVVLHRGATVKFADVDLKTWNIDPDEIEKATTGKTKTIIPVHLHGRPADMDAIGKIANKHKLYVIEDAAHAAEAWYHGKKIGSIGDFTAFSFYATKNVATGEGGMLTTNNKKWYDTATVRALHGLSADAWKRYSAAGFKPYEAVYPGYKINMTDIQASLGLPQLQSIEKNLKIRNKIWGEYQKAFSKINCLQTPSSDESNIIHARHLYALAFKPEMLKIDRNKFVAALQKEGIGCGVHFTPVHLMEYYRKTFEYKLGDFPNAERIGLNIFSLPIYPTMNKKDISDVINAVVKLVTYYRR